MRAYAASLRGCLAEACGDPGVPNPIIKPRPEVVLFGMPHAVEPDTLVASDQDRFYRYRTVEMKSYVDRAGWRGPRRG
jgi:hypothetical protein